MDRQTQSTIADVLFSISIVCALLAAWCYLYQDLWLASSQWVQIAAVLGIYATYVEIKDAKKRK